jgi:hypothetical protein
VANEEADRLEAESAAARKRAAAAANESQAIASQWARVEQGQKLAAGDELKELSARTAAVLAVKPDKAPVMHDTRLYARTMLQNYALGDPGPLPQLHDPLWGSLHGLQGQLVGLMGRLGDVELYAAADALECRLHRACLARLRWLAGEAE